MAKKVLRFHKEGSGESAEQFADRMNAKFGEKVELGELLTNVYNFLARFVCYPSEHAHVAHVLWIAHAHLMDAWESTPRAGVSLARASVGQNQGARDYRIIGAERGAGDQCQARLSVPQGR